MKKIEILVNGKAFPCQQTAGAMLRFKELTDKEVSEIDPRSITDLIKFLWCCVSSASNREGKEFDMSLMDFADAIGPEELDSWQKSLTAENSEEKDAESSKKKTSRLKKS